MKQQRIRAHAPKRTAPLFDAAYSDGAKRALYLGGLELPDGNAAAHRALGNAKILRALGWDVAFVGVARDMAAPVGSLEAENSVQGFRRFAVPYPAGGRQWLRYLTDAKPYIEACEAVGGVTLLILYNTPSPVMAQLLHYCRARRIRCVADCTEWYSSRGKGMAYALLKALDTGFRMRILQKQLDGIIVISRYLERYYAKHPRVVCLPPLTDLEETKWRLAQRDEASPVLRLVYAGSPERKDRVDLLVEALRLVKRPVHLDVVGLSREEYLLRQPEHRVFLEQTECIAFHGRCSHLAALAFVQRADFSCFFREDDRVSRAGFPTKFVEAISCQTPVITNATSDLAEYLRDPRFGCCVEQLTGEAIAAVMERVERVDPVPQDRFDYHHYTQAMKRFLYGESNQ
jgi:glycosyltransferase involved in cell wall biosynthesis